MGIQVGGQAVMTPLETLISKSANPQGWSLVLNEECSSIVEQFDRLESTLDFIYIFLSKLNIYLPNDGYPNDLVMECIKAINSYWDQFPHSA